MNRHLCFLILLPPGSENDDPSAAGDDCEVISFAEEIQCSPKT